MLKFYDSRALKAYETSGVACETPANGSGIFEHFLGVDYGSLELYALINPHEAL